MDRLFLDANVLFSAAYSENSRIKKIWVLKGVKLISSNYAVEEARRNLRDVDKVERLHSMLEHIEIHTEYDDVLLPQNIKLREKDRPILAAAIGSNVSYLIAGDVRDFGCFFGKTIKGVVILPPADYFSLRLSQ